MWIALPFSIVIYTILFFYLRGYITIVGWHIYLSRSEEPTIIVPKKHAYGLLL
jgi:hypothetical protein